MKGDYRRNMGILIESQWNLNHEARHTFETNLDKY